MMPPGQWIMRNEDIISKCCYLQPREFVIVHFA